jgi:hypothetical protein
MVIAGVCVRNVRVAVGVDDVPPKPRAVPPPNKTNKTAQTTSNNNAIPATINHGETVLGSVSPKCAGTR